MLKTTLIIVGFAACLAEPDVRKVMVEYVQGTLDLQPPIMVPSDTKWELTTCDNCKMVLSCKLNGQNCDSVHIKIWDGVKTWSACDEKKLYAFKSSIKNKMSLQITTNGAEIRANCQVTATKPFIDLPKEEIDSSEHGVEAESVDCRCGWSNKQQQRIVGGKETKINEYPFPVVFLVNFEPICGGSIITPWHVLTAAHCTYPNKDEKIAIAAGDHDINSFRETKATQVIQVEEIIDHPDYNPKNLQNDISILYLKSELRFNDQVGPVCMPENIRNLVSDHVKIMGWGSTQHQGDSSDVLLKANLKVIEPDTCELIYGTDPKNTLCTYGNGKDSCQGDSGGPVLWLNERNKFTLVGVVSFGLGCASTNPGVNTNVASYMKWIKSEISRTKPQRICH